MGKKAKWVRCFGNIPPLAMGGWGGTLPKLLPIYINRTPLPLGQITNKNAQNPKNSSLSKNLFRFNFFYPLENPLINSISIRFSSIFTPPKFIVKLGKIL